MTQNQILFLHDIVDKLQAGGRTIRTAEILKDRQITEEDLKLIKAYLQGML